MSAFVPLDGYLSVPVYMPVQSQNPLAPPPPYTVAIAQPNPFVAGPPGFPANPPPHPGWAPGGPLALPWARPTALPTTPPAAPPAAPPASPPTPPAPATPAGDDYPPGIHIDGDKALLQGANYLYPREHTTIRVIKGDFDPLSNPGKEFDFWIFKTPTILTVGDLIHQLGAQSGGNDKCGVTELLEVGGGCWTKGITIFQKDDQKKQTLAALGWDQTRGTSRPPVWLKLHKG
jgi:hypothetical protein